MNPQAITTRRTATDPETPLHANIPPSAYRIGDACYQLGIGRTSLYGLIKAGKIRTLRIAGRTLVPRSEIERLTSVETAA